MSAILEVEPEIAQKLLALAQSKGVSVDDLLRAAASKLSLTESKNGMGNSERATAFRVWAAGHPETTPLLSEDAVSRRAIYHGNGLSC